MEYILLNASYSCLESPFSSPYSLRTMCLDTLWTATAPPLVKCDSSQGFFSALFFCYLVTVTPLFFIHIYVMYRSDCIGHLKSESVVLAFKLTVNCGILGFFSHRVFRETFYVFCALLEIKIWFRLP